MESRWRRAFRMAALSGVVGFGAGIVISGFVGALGGRLLVALPVFFGLVTGTAGYLYGAIFMEGTADLARRLYMGGKMGGRREFSNAQTMAARGDYAAALEVYAAAAEEFPSDPSPLIQGARVLRDGLADPRRAEAWLQRARRVPGLQAAEDVTIAQELVDLYDGPLDEPRKALPELARIVGRYPGTRAASWAANTMQQIRASVWTDVKADAASNTERAAEPDTEPEGTP